MQAIGEQGILPFELVVINLYPFAATIARPDTSVEEAVEQIDIGGPSLIRAAAKNSDFVTVVCDPMRYSKVLGEIAENGSTSLQTRKELMAAAFRYTADYDKTIADYFSSEARKERLPSTLHLVLKKKTDLRYGENSHHMAEALFKAMGRALGQAYRQAGDGEVRSTKGTLTE